MNPFWEIFQWPPFPSPKAFRSTVSLSENPHRRRLFWRPFSGEVLFRHRPYHQVRKEEIFKFCQSIEWRFSAMRRPHVFLLQRPEPHALPHEDTWRTFRPRASTSSLTWHRLATLHLCLCHPSPASAFFWVFCLRRPSKQPFQRPLVTSSPPRALHVS